MKSRPLVQTEAPQSGQGPGLPREPAPLLARLAASQFARLQFVGDGQKGVTGQLLAPCLLPADAYTCLFGKEEQDKR